MLAMRMPVHPDRQTCGGWQDVRGDQGRDCDRFPTTSPAPVGLPAGSPLAEDQLNEFVEAVVTLFTELGSVRKAA
ncbi:Intracellular protease [Azospirillum palustre]